MSGRLSEIERAIVLVMAQAYREPAPRDDLDAAYNNGWQEGAYSIMAAVAGSAAAARCERTAYRLARFRARRGGRLRRRRHERDEPERSDAGAGTVADEGVEISGCATNAPDADELRDLRLAVRAALTHLEAARRWQWRLDVSRHPEAAERIAEALTAARAVLAEAVG